MVCCVVLCACLFVCACVLNVLCCVCALYNDIDFCVPCYVYACGCLYAMCLRCWCVVFMRVGLTVLVRFVCGLLCGVI